MFLAKTSLVAGACVAFCVTAGRTPGGCGRPPPATTRRCSSSSPARPRRSPGSDRRRPHAGRHPNRAQAGLARMRPGGPMAATDRFRVASITKSFVATIVLQLVAEGKLRLDDTVERWLPGLVPDGRAITIRELLDHTSGLFEYQEDRPSSGR